MKVIVLDINCLLQILPRKAPKRWLYDLILQGKVSLALSSEIILEYQEILEQRIMIWAGAVKSLKGEFSVPIMTIHKSKGLEYEIVIFLGLEDSAFWNFLK